MRRTIVLALSILASLAAHAGAQTVSGPLGTASGGVAVYYRSSVEDPSNISYLRAQFSPTNTNGGAFAFDSTNPVLGTPYTFSDVFGDVGQYGFDMIVPIDLTNSPPIPLLTPYDNVDGSLANRAAGTPGSIEWAINDYNQNPSIPGYGPQTPGNEVINSVLRGPSGTLNSTLTAIPGGYQIDFSGELISDGFIHWSNPSTADTPLSALGGEVHLLFNGTLTYLTATDTTPGMDWYAGNVNLSLQYTPAPEPSTLALAGCGALGLAAVVRRKRRRA
jgi:hypothetical protein